MNAHQSRAWATGAAVTLLVGAVALRTDLTALLILTALSAAGTAILAVRTRRSAASGVCTAVLLAFTALLGWNRAERSRFAATPDVGRMQIELDATRRLAAIISAEGDALRRLADAALDVPAEPAAAFDALERLRGSESHRAAVVLRGGALAAWSGRYVAPADSLPGPVGVVATEFHLVLYAVATRGSDEAIATALVHAAPPADRIGGALDQALLTSLNVAGFAFARPSSAADTTGLVVLGGVPVLSVRAAALGAPQIVQRMLEEGIERGTLALAVALVLFLAATWRAGDLRLRFGALGVVLATVALLPLAALSNRTVLLNPAFFFVAGGGPLSASVGALAVTAAAGLVAVIAAERAGLYPRRRAYAVLIIVVVATLGPFLLGAIGRGIRFPATGAPVSLWLAWETAVFLGALAVLYAGLAAGETALGTRRGLPLWLPPAFAAGATALAPAVVQARGGLPSWYTVLWVIAAVGMALARRGGRRTLWAAAAVAAFGSAALVWSESVKARVLLAEQDVAALGTPDPAAGALADRFRAFLDPGAAARTRAELLARFAASELASSDLPVNVTTWTPQGTVIADLRVGLGPGTARGIEFFAREAADANRPVLTNVPGEPGILTIMAVPHADRSVTTVLVAPRTRLVVPDPFAALVGMGRARDAGGEPPYTLQFAPASQSPVIATVPNWTRRNDELHGDWFLPSASSQVLHVHARVPLAAYGALTTRGALLVGANLGLMGLLLMLLAAADGGAMRRFRDVTRDWVRSYRARLTVSLFTAFMLPAGAFAVWSYGRLQSEDAAARELLVRETLRGVTSAPGSGLDSLAARFGTPLLLFADGVLVAASDPLLESIAPIGRLVPAAAARELIVEDDGFATARLPVGRDMLHFGFRVVADSSGAPTVVLATPARTAELALDPRRRDLAFFVIFATLVGALGALVVSGLAGQTFARPIGALREGALALAAGEREPRLAGSPPLEFEPVFHAFRQMARDLEAGRARDARAQRVLAWGEMARQVAHEIKNPLTPMRLGVQHLIRAKDDPRVDFREVFDQNAARLLSEIDRLDEIARAFSRYGTAPEFQPPAEPVDVAEAVRDVVRLEQLGADGVVWTMDGVDAPLRAMARPTELREVLLNLLENARQAGATRVSVDVSYNSSRVRITVADDGHGIPEESLPRIFEPHFSTRTSGSGLGLAITRRLVDGWGGAVQVTSTAGTGTSVTVSLVPATVA